MYDILKLKFSSLIDSNFNLSYDTDQENVYKIAQQQNPLFRQIQLITNKDMDKFIKEIIFLDIDRTIYLDDSYYKNLTEDKINYKEKLIEILDEGFIYNNKKYMLFGKSASMARNLSIGFVSSDIWDELTKRSMMDIDLQSCVVSKFEAYRCLLFSSCHYISEKLPYIVIVKDYERLIKNQNIKYVIPEEVEFEKDGEIKKYTNYKIRQGVDDVKISLWDGMGLHSFEMGEEFKEALDVDYVPPAVQVRLPLCKGVSVCFDIHKYFNEDEYIEDYLGNTHKVSDIDCIWTESMWKGIKYFKNWKEYEEKFEKYNHVFGISKYSKLVEREKIYSRSNFQYLQTLPKLNKENVLELAQYSKNYIEKIIQGDKLYTMNFLGLMGDELEQENEINNNYIKAILTNKIMLKDKTIQKSIYRLLQKTIKEMKLGRFFVKAHYSMVVGDIKALLEHIRGEDPIGFLQDGEFYCPEYNGNYVGFRSPLVHKSEVNKMNFIKNDFSEKWLSHLSNIIILNGYDISMPRMGGMDQDGDIIWVADNELMYNSIEDVDTAVVVDKDDKITIDPTKYDKENIITYHLRTIGGNDIGLITNIATGLLNRQSKNQKTLKYIDDNVAFLRLAQGKSIDSIKTGFKYKIASYLRKEKKPYFLIYKYDREKQFYDKIRKKIK